MDTIEFTPEEMKGFAKLYEYTFASKDDAFYSVGLFIDGKGGAWAVWMVSDSFNKICYKSFPAWFPECKLTSWMGVR